MDTHTNNAFAMPPVPSGKQLNLQALKKHLGQSLVNRRKNIGDEAYFIIFLGNDLTREMSLIADCGLRKDIHQRILEGELSFNKSWKESLVFEQENDLARFRLDTAQTPLSRQIKAVFGSHTVESIGGVVQQLDEHNFVVFLEAHSEKMASLDAYNISDEDIRPLGELVYLVFLKEASQSRVSLWENAIHEIASPLDFIYSNSDFMLEYLNAAHVPLEQKKRKLEDLKIIAQLLINRLHQFRYAFAGTSEVQLRADQHNLYEICMPITHLWHHEARRKSLNFIYDDLRGLPKIIVDREIFQAVMFNLISNAIKYSNRNTEIRLFAERHLSKYRVGVTNQGIGISDGAKVFQPYYRSPIARRHDARGMGIGLAVCKQLMAVCGGSIRVEDPRPQSTTFIIEFPQT